MGSGEITEAPVKLATGKNVETEGTAAGESSVTLVEYSAATIGRVVLNPLL